MNDLPRILRLGFLVPVAFISIAAAFVTSVITFRAWQLEKEVIEAQKVAIEGHVFHEVTKIADEVFVLSDNWKTRESMMAAYFHKRGIEARIRFEPAHSRRQAKVEKRKLPAWRHTTDQHPHEVLEAPLYFHDTFVGTIFVELIWSDIWSFGGMKDLAMVVLLTLIVVIAVWYVTFTILRRKVFAPILERMMKLSRLEAISETTQMIAHDISKPFHILRLSLQALREADGPKETENLINTLTPTIEKVSAEVNDMLRDIVDLEKPQNLRLAETSISQLIRTSLEDFIDEQNEKDCAVGLSFEHKHQVKIDRFKVLRVISNLLQNAFQAVDRGGQVWIKTLEVNDKRNGASIVVCIGNSGSTISKEDRSRMFERFFTKGKQNGTGLGLAIAKKFIKAHGGQIWCESSGTSGTEFRFSLPLSDFHLDEVVNRFYTMFPDGSAGLGSFIGATSIVDHQNGDLTPPVPIQNRSATTKILLISNDDFFRDGVIALLKAYTSDDGIYPKVIGSFSLEESKEAQPLVLKAEVILIDCRECPNLESLSSALGSASQSTLMCLYSNGLTQMDVPSWAAACKLLSKPIDSSMMRDILAEVRGKRKTKTEG